MKYITQKNRILNNKYIIDKLNPIHFVKKNLIIYELKKILNSEFAGSEIQIADLGCGNGLISNELSKLGQVDAFDKDMSSLSIAKLNKTSSVRFFHKNIETLRKKNIYDIVVCSEVLQYIKNDVMALKKLHTILKPHGYLILTVPFNKNLTTEFDKREKSRRYSLKEAVKKMSKANFKVKRVRFWGYPLLQYFYFRIYIPRSNQEVAHVTKVYEFSKIVLLLLKFSRYLFLTDLLFNSKRAFDLLIIGEKNK